MANHCYNYVSGYGSKQDLIRLQSVVTLLASKDTNLDNFVSCWAQVYPLFFPQSVGEQEEDETKTYFDVYDIWGSRWFEAEFDIDPEDGSYTICGDSAWSPVLPFFLKLCKEYNLDGEGYYDEPGMDFAGTFTISKDGNFEEKMITSRQFRMEDNPEGFWSDMLEQIEEGCYETMEDILAEFDVDYWGKLSAEDLAELQKAFDLYQSKEEEDDQETK